MSPLELTLESGTAYVNGELVKDFLGVKFNQLLETHLHGKERIDIYSFHRYMLPIKAKRTGFALYKFEGPNLGIYSDIVDIREGPYVNHHLHQLEITVSYLSDMRSFFTIKGEADITNSYIDKNSYKGPTSGHWDFEVSFVHNLPR